MNNKKNIVSKKNNQIQKIDIKFLILLIIVFALIIINLIIYLKNTVFKKQEELLITPITVTSEENEQQTTTIIKTQEELIKYLSTLGERDRMQYYCGTFFKHLKHADYEAAYNLLYTEFKQNYFPTIEDFEEYAQAFYPKYFALEYDDITRQGDIYVLRLKIIDVKNESAEENIQRIVIKENYYNDFEMSFQVKDISNEN